jgi:tetratricopeptide (TPR) repeat protein
MEQAIDHCRQALQLDPANAIAHYNLAILLDSEGSRDEAIEHYVAALRIDPSMDEARSYLEEVIRRERGQPRARVLLEQLRQLESEGPCARRLMTLFGVWIPTPEF